MGVLDMLGRPSRRSGGMSPVMVGLMGLLAYRTLKGKGRLADMLGTGSDATGAAGPLAGGTLGGGLRSTRSISAERSGHEGPSWVAKGPNQPIAPR